MMLPSLVAVFFLFPLDYQGHFFFFLKAVLCSMKVKVKLLSCV